MRFRTLALLVLLLGSSSSVHAACAFENTTSVKLLAAAFEAWKAVSEAMAECGNVEAELDQEFRTKQPAAFAADPSLYQVGGVSNGTLTPLVNAGTIRPLDGLVEQYGQHLKPNQLIQMDGEIMAVAMMVNTQHLMYRQDIFEDLGIAVPTTYDEVLAAAATIQEAGVVDYPLGATLQTGWNLAQEFNNLFLGFGGSFVNPDNTPNLNSEAGIQALELMKALTAYMDPEYLVSDSTYVQQQFQQGKIAMANLWASRAGAMDDPDESQVVGLVVGAAAPAVAADSPPATTLWWDGIVIARNISDAEAEAAFQVAMEGMDQEMVAANNDVAVWLIDGYQPTPMAQAAIASAAGGAPAYPSTTQMGLIHSAVGNNIADFLTGAESAEQALMDAEAEYLRAAREAGLVE